MRISMALKSTQEPHDEISLGVERIRQLCSGLDTTLKNLEHQRIAIKKLRDEADALCKLFVRVHGPKG